MTDINRPEAWKIGWVDAHECREASNPFSPESLEFYTWAAGYQAGVRDCLPAGRLLVKGYLYRDDNGEYWFYDPESGVVRCLGDEDTGEEGGYGWKFDVQEAKEELMEGGYFKDTPVRMKFEDFWTLSHVGKSDLEGE